MNIVPVPGMERFHPASICRGPQPLLLNRACCILSTVSEENKFGGRGMGMHVDFRMLLGSVKGPSDSGFIVHS